MKAKNIIKFISYFLFGFILVFLILDVLANYWLPQKMEHLIKNKFSESTDSLYNLSFDKLSISLLSKTISVNNISIVPKHGKQNLSKTYSIKIKHLKFANLSILSYVKNKKLSIGRIECIEPVVLYYINSNDSISVKKITSKKNTTKSLNAISIKKMDIINVKFSIYKNAIDSFPIFESYENSIISNNINLNLKNIHKDSFLLADQLDVTLNNIKYNIEGSLYAIYSKKILASFSNSSIHIDSLKLIPIYNKIMFADKSIYQTSRTEFYAAHLEVKQFDYNLLIKSKIIDINKIEMSDCFIDIYRDNTRPLKQKNRPSLQTIIKQIPILCSLDTIEVKNGKLNFEALNPKTNTVGTISLDKIKVSVYGITNDSINFTENQSVEATINGYILNKGNFTESYRFPLKASTELFYCSGSVSSMPLSSFNSIIASSRQLKFKSGEIDTISFSFKAEENYSNGTMAFKYHDLRIEVLNQKNSNSIKLDVSTFLLNKFKIEKSNPLQNKKTRISKLHVKHNPYRYFLFYSMQSILSGIEPSIKKE